MIEDYDNTKKDTAILFIIAVILALVIFSCKPAQVITLTDTIKQIEYKTKYEKEIVRFDSIVTKTDTFDNIVFRDRTVFQTKEKTKIDTVISDREVIKMNPLNEQLKDENYTLQSKLSNRNKQTTILVIFILLFSLLWFIKRKLKFVF